VIILAKLYHSDVLTDSQLAFLAEQLPEPHAQTGRPAYTNRELLPGILAVLRSGCRWRDLNRFGYPDGSTHWRRMRYWKCNLRGRPPHDPYGRETKPKNYLSVVWGKLLDLLLANHMLELQLLCLDGTLVPSFDFLERVSFSGKHRSLGVKVLTLVEATGIPIDVTIAPGSWNDGKLASVTIEDPHPHTILRGALLLADRGYDSFEFRSYLSWKGLASNIPKRATTLGEEHACYHYSHHINRFRFIIERTNAWVKSFKRLQFRRDYTTYSFECFLYLPLIVICVRRLLN
jgi:transposase